MLALSLVCRLEHADAESLFSVCGMKMRDDDVRDVVVGYLLKQKIFNEDMRDSCLREYKITCLPIKRKQAEAPAPEQAE